MILRSSFSNKSAFIYVIELCHLSFFLLSPIFLQFILEFSLFVFSLSSYFFCLLSLILLMFFHLNRMLLPLHFIVTIFHLFISKIFTSSCCCKLCDRFFVITRIRTPTLPTIGKPMRSSLLRHLWARPLPPLNIIPVKTFLNFWSEIFLHAFGLLIVCFIHNHWILIHGVLTRFVIITLIHGFVVEGLRSWGKISIFLCLPLSKLFFEWIFSSYWLSWYYFLICYVVVSDTTKLSSMFLPFNSRFSHHMFIIWLTVSSKIILPFGHQLVHPLLHHFLFFFNR